MLVPLQDVLVLELIENKKDNLIAMPDTFEPEKDESAVFKVVAAGPGVWDSGIFVPNSITAGDTVITARYGISKFKYKGEKVILANARDIMLKIEEKER